VSREHLALAADIGLSQALALYERVSADVGVVKVGLSLFVEHGPGAVKAFTDRRAKVFLDLKLHDIPNTVQLAAERAGALGVSYLTVHAGGGEAMLRAAKEGVAVGARSKGLQPPVVLAVTVLTSMDEPSLEQVGVQGPMAAQVERLMRVAQVADVGGIVCSPREAAAARALLGPRAVVCTPGIRPVGAAKDDQTRVETPAAARAAGASLLVVGRPIYASPDPVAAARAIREEVESASA
jgi:orotidine-5'-phosphate decarboxylase